MAARRGTRWKSRSRLSVIDQHALRIAAAFAKGRPPQVSPDLEAYLANSPRQIYAALEGVARHMPPVGGNGDLAFGYLFLLKGLLEHLRYGADRGYAEPAALIAEFQEAIAAQTGQMERGLLAHVSAALQQASIAVSPQLLAAMETRIAEEAKRAPVGRDIDGAISGMLDACDGDPFALMAQIAGSSHAVPDGLRAAMVGSLALGKSPQARATAVLFLLDPDPAVRGTAADALGDAAATLGPADVRRLIAIRNWRPESERASIDAIVRKARTAGIDCAAWPAGGAEAILASAIDGTSSQGIMLISPAGRKKRLSSILARGGIADAWSGEPETRRQIEASLSGAGTDVVLLPVSRAYLDREVAHQLAAGIDKGRVPPSGLLQVAETTGSPSWQPQSIDFAGTLADLIGEIPKRLRDPISVTAVLQGSDRLSDLGLIAEAWFEDDPEVARIVAGGRNASLAKRVAYLLQTAIARRRDSWADRFLRTAVWLRDASGGGDLCWRELALVAKAVAEGGDLAEIGLMRDIARRTIIVQDDSAHASSRWGG